MDTVMDSDHDSAEDELVVASTPQKKKPSREPSAPPSVLSMRPREPTQEVTEGQQRAKSSSADSGSKVAVVMVSGPARPWEYTAFDHSTTVDEILEEVQGPDKELWYRIQYEDGKTENLPADHILKLRNGRNAIDLFTNGGDEAVDSENQSSMSSSIGKRIRKKTKNEGYVDVSSAQLDSSEDEHVSGGVSKKRRLERGRVEQVSNRQSSRVSTRQSSRRIHDKEDEDEDTSESDNQPLTRRSGRQSRPPPSRTRVTRSLSTKPAIVEDDEDELAGPPGSDDDDEDSDIVFEAPKKRSARNPRTKSLPRGKGTARRRAKFSAAVDGNDEESSDYSERPEPTRKSGRATQNSKSMREQGEDEVVYADDVATTTAPKVISVREIFQPIAEKDPFKVFHSNECDVCHGKGKHSNKGTSPLIHCQGCSTSIHKVCLGYRSGRDHMVTKIAHESFVMQCRRCIGLAIKKDKSAPRLDVCQSCKEPGAACAAFSKKKTSKQEEKLREENDGQDPITDVASDLINNAKNILFRCDSCQRAYHYEHLPSRTKKSNSKSKSKDFEDEDELRGLRHKEYHDYKCKECVEQPAKVQTLVAWRPTDRETYVEGDTVDMYSEDEKEYLIKWEELSYFKCTWMPGAWVWGITHATMRNSFARRDEGANLLPKWTSEEAIPEDYLRMEIIFDVTYTDDFEAESEEVDKENIGYVDEVWVKFVGLGYEEAVWQERPAPEQPEQWSSFVAAYNEYIAGKYFKQLPATDLKARIESFREELDFEKDVKYSDDRQPSALEGGELMPYQRTGCNWLLKNFHATKSVILADDMGLGKTIQIVSMIASLVKDKPQCWPFLVVTPNSTCPNWRREIKKWAPSLRVVAYYGGKAARDMAMNYELYPDGCKDMRAHIVITSYEGPTNDDSRSFFKKIKWAGMVIDEGQRLKNDENLLYGALKALKVDFRVLLTGTPLQNNLRELFNLLQFVDPSMKAAELEQKYDGNNMDSKSVKECQQLIEPYFMRRTKNEVLKFLPPMAQVIVPTTMSVLQKTLYKSILAKNPELIKSIFGQTTATLRPQEKGNLNNILMQLRKVLCHPFMFSNAIEEKSEDSEVVHRNLIDASSKLQLLDIMLPKLKERGHRVLIFSQFLDHITIIEDFLNGLGLAFTRIDGKISAMEKQKRIDAFNAPNSHLFACLLSTRAGGVGINLATADTVIIMDPDFNPHQDIQALSRAHRIGQTKKVLVFQLMTKDSAEEKITQIGRKKMALDHALIETMGADEEVAVDVESILKHGAEALFNDDDSNDIHYDSASIDKLLDRSKMEKTSTDEDNIQASAFAHARIWTNDKLSDDVGDPDTVSAVPDASVWAKILKQREADAAAEAAKNVQTLGRGKRVRKDVDYQKAELHNDNSPEKGNKRRADESDIEFASVVDSDDDDDYDAPQPGDVDVRELQTGKARRTSGSPTANKQGTKTKKPVTPSKPASKQTASAKPASKSTKPTKSVGNSTVSNKQTSSVKSAIRGAALSKQKVSAKVPAKVPVKAPAKAPVKGLATSNVKVVKKATTTQQTHPNTPTSSRNSKNIDLQNSDGAGKQRASAKRPAESSVSGRPNQKPKIEQEKDVANSPSLQPANSKILSQDTLKAKSSSPDTTQSPTIPPINNIHPASIKQDVQINIPATKDHPSEGSNINNTHPISKTPSNTSNTLPISTQVLLTQARPIQELPGQIMETILPSQERQSDMNHSRKESSIAFPPQTPQDWEEILPLPSNQPDPSLNQDS